MTNTGHNEWVRGIVAVLLFMMMVLASARSVVAQDDKTFTGENLATSCASDSAVEQGICAGYISGAMAAWQGSFANFSEDDKYLVLYEVTLKPHSIRSIAEEIMAWVKDHPTHADDPAAVVLAAVLHKNNELATTLAVDERLYGKN